MSAFELGKPTGPKPQINVWLEPTPTGFMVVAKHSLDASDQRIFIIQEKGGALEVLVQTLHARHLCDALGIPMSAAPRLADYATGAPYEMATS